VCGCARPEKVRVEIEISTSGSVPFIEIRDNATGIAFKDFNTAFKVASVPPDRSGLNEFGMGMKTAGFWFSNDWTVRTSFCGEPVARKMRFNLGEILSKKLKEIEPEESPSSASGHFTTVRLGQLNQVPVGRTVGRIKDHLTGIYREFLREGVLELIYNGESLNFEEPAVLVAPIAGEDLGESLEWKKQISFNLETGRQVTGWAGILEKGSTSKAGFGLFRKRRLILGSSDETFRPSSIFGASNSFEWQRLFGEIHFDSEIGVTHTKDDFNWSDGEEEDFIEKLRAAVTDSDMDLVRQAKGYRVRGARPDPKHVEHALDSVKTTLERVIPQSLMEINPAAQDIDVSIPEFIKPAASLKGTSQSVELSVDTGIHGSWRVRVAGVSDEAVSDFFKMGATENALDPSGRHMTVLDLQVNLSHPFAVKYLGPNLENSEFLFSFTSSLAIALALGRAAGARSNYIIDYINDILRFGGGL
jgi:hypothetical protein